MWLSFSQTAMALRPWDRLGEAFRESLTPVSEEENLVTSSKRRFRLAGIAAAGVALAGLRGDAQQAGFAGRVAPDQASARPASQVPTGRQGRGGYPLPALPAVFETYQHKVRVSVVARGLDRPWSLLILPDGDMLVSMRYSNEIRAIRKGVLDPKPLTGCRRCAGSSTS